MRALPVPVLFALVLATFAGCFGAGRDVREDLHPVSQFAYGTFRCADGRTIPFETAGDGNGSRCNVRITGQPPGMNGPANELTISADPTNGLRLVAGAKDYTLAGADQRCGPNRVWAGYYWSEDGGYTWGNALMPGHDQGLTGQATNPLAGYGCTTDPVVVWDDDGHAFYSGLSYSAARAPALPSQVPLVTSDTVGSNVWIARSDNGGKTWTPRLVAQADGVTAFHDKQWFTVDYGSGNIYVTWSLFLTPPGNGTVSSLLPQKDPSYLTDQIVFSRSTDGGRTYSAPTVLFETNTTGTTQVPDPEFDKQFSTPAVDRAGRIYVLWNALGTFWMTRSEDQGLTWSDAQPILATVPEVPNPLPPTSFRTHTYPILAVDRSKNNETTGTLYVVYSAKNGTDNADVFLVRSRDAGRTWSSPMRVNDDNTTRDQFMPWADVGPQGDLHVAFYDRRDDPQNRDLHLYYAHSKNGTRFDPNVRVTELPINATLSRHQGGFEFMGDYLGVSEGPNGWVHPIWVDTRDGRADAYTAVLQR